MPVIRAVRAVMNVIIVDKSILFSLSIKQLFNICIVVYVWFFGRPALLITFRRFATVAKFGTDYFPLKIKILAKRERELTTKFAIARNGC